MTADSQIQVLLLHRCDVNVFRQLKEHHVHNYYMMTFKFLENKPNVLS